MEQLVGAYLVGMTVPLEQVMYGFVHKLSLYTTSQRPPLIVAVKPS